MTARTHWRMVQVTMLQSWRERLLDACHKLGMRIDGAERGATKFTAYIETTRTPTEVEDQLRAQLQFDGWMEVEEEQP